MLCNLIVSVKYCVQQWDISLDILLKISQRGKVLNWRMKQLLCNICNDCARSLIKTFKIQRHHTNFNYIWSYNPLLQNQWYLSTSNATNAFDSIKSSAMLHILHVYALPDKLIAGFKTKYDNQEIFVLSPEKATDTFFTTTGIT